jgi:hypothetical protein
MKKLFIALSIVLALSTAAYGAGSCTITSENFGGFVYTVFEWTSDASGDVSAGTGCTSGQITGALMHVITIPSAASGLVPTDNYDIDFEDATDVNVTGTYLDNRDTANRERVQPRDANADTIYFYKDTLEVVVANSGNVTSGKAIIVTYPSEFLGR